LHLIEKSKNQKVLKYNYL